MTGRQNGFVGREGPLADLVGDLARARAGSPGVVLVVGEAGVGKTALTRHLVQTSPDARAVVVRCEEAEAAVDHAVVDHLLGRHGSFVGAGAHSAVGLPRGQALLEFLGAAQLGTPAAVIVIDDLHCADRPSLMSIAFAVRRLRQEHVMLVLTSRRRPEGKGPLERALADAQVRCIDLTGLSEAETAALITARTGRAPLPHVAAHLSQVTAGNPLWLESVLSQVSVDRLPMDEPLPVPSSLAESVRRQLGALTPEAARALDALAVLGGPQPAGRVGRLVGSARLWAALDEAVAAGLLVRTGNPPMVDLDFRHPLIGAVVASDLPLQERADLHTAAAVLSADRAHQVAHLLGAATPPDERASAEGSAFAGERLAAGAFGQASDLLLSAAALTTRERAAGELRVAAAEAALTGGLFAQARHALGLAGSWTGPRRQYVEGFLAWLAGDHVSARRLLGTAWEDSGRTAAGAAVVLGQVELLAARGADAVAWAGQSLALGDPQAHDVALSLRAMGLVIQGRPLQGLCSLGPVPGEVGPLQLDSETVRGIALMYLDRLDEARVCLRGCLGASRRLGVYRLSSVALTTLADVEHRAGRWDQSTQSAEASLAYAQSFEEDWALGPTHAIAAIVHARRGDVFTARDHLVAAQDAAGRTGGLAATACTYVAQVLAAHAHSDLPEVLRVGRLLEGLPRRDAVDVPGAFQWWPLYLEAQVRTGATGGTGAAGPATVDGPASPAGPAGPATVDGPASASAAFGTEKRLEHFEHLATEGGISSAQGGAARVRGVLYASRGEVARASAAFDRSVALLEQAAMPFEASLSQLYWGEHVRRTGRRREADAHLRAAAEGFDALGAHPYAHRARREQAAGGRPSRRTRPSDLTAQERVVAELVAQGMTNRQIAEELVLSVRTVEFHVGSVYRKLSVSSRSQLTRFILQPPAANA
jgi:DNA-binding CsgD family transcriptional regulator